MILIKTPNYAYQHVVYSACTNIFKILESPHCVVICQPKYGLCCPLRFCYPLFLGFLNILDKLIMESNSCTFKFFSKLIGVWSSFLSAHIVFWTLFMSNLTKYCLIKYCSALFCNTLSDFCKRF